MLYLINGTKTNRWEFENSMETVAKKMAQESLDKYLNLIYMDTCIEDCTIKASEIMKTCRPKEYGKMLHERFTKIDNDSYKELMDKGEVVMNGVKFEVNLLNES